MQLGEPKQFNSWLQQLPAMQSPQAEPSLGQLEGPQKPAMQRPEQHSSGPPQNEPSAEHCSSQRPFTQLLLQQSSKEPHMLPVGRQAGSQTPPVHVPLQQSAPIMQPRPSGAHTPQFAPQTFCARATQLAPHWPLQHEGSLSQTALAQALQPSTSGAPCTQTS